MKKLPEELYQVLKKGEEVKFAFKQSLYFEAKPKWIFITNYRIIFLDLNIGGFKSLEVPYEELKYFEFYTGFFFSRMIIRDEKGNNVRVPFLRKPRGDEWDEIVDHITEKVQEVSVENPTVKMSKFFFIKRYAIQKVSESAGRVKMQYVPVTAENNVGQRMIEHKAPKNIATLSYEEAKKIVFESEKKHEQIKALKDLYENNLIDDKTYNDLKEEILSS